MSIIGRSSKKDDLERLEAMIPLLEALWKNLRYLDDLRVVWPRLTDAQRAEVEASSVHRNRFHEQSVESAAAELRGLARGLRSYRYWRLRGLVIEFIENWREQEPDKIKVLTAMIKRHLPGDPQN